MERIIKYIVIYFLLISFISCNKNETEVTVSLEANQTELLRLGEPVQLISLQNTKNSQLEYIEKVAFDVENNRIFVQSDLNIFFFDANGKFITKLKKGRGPGEISNIIYFTIDRRRKLIYATQDQANIFCIIDYNGNLVKKHQLVNYYCQAIYPIDNENVFLLNNTVNSNNPWFVGVYNLEKEMITQSYIPANESKYPLLIYPMVSNFMKYKDHLYFVNANIFGMFEFKKNVFNKLISYELGDREAPKDFSDKFEQRRRSNSFEAESKRLGYIPNLINTFFFKEYNFVIIGDKLNSCYAIDAKSHYKIYLSKTIASYFNLPDVKSLKNPVEIEEDYLTFGCQPLDFYKPEEFGETKQLTFGDETIEVNYDSNPFLIIVK